MPVASSTPISGPDLRGKLRALEERTREVAGACESAADRIEARGLAPDEELALRIESLLQSVAELQDLLAAEATPTGEPLGEREGPTLAGLARAIDRVEEERKRREHARQVIAQSRRVLETAVSLRHADDERFAPLVEARAAAEGLLVTLQPGTGGEVPDLVAALLDGSHPLAALVCLAGGGDELDDARWAELQERVVKEFGKSLGAAVARGRIRAERSLPNAEETAH